jgi:hypothetical protein
MEMPACLANVMRASNIEPAGMENWRAVRASAQGPPAITSDTPSSDAPASSARERPAVLGPGNFDPGQATHSRTRPLIVVAELDGAGEGSVG